MLDYTGCDYVMVGRGAMGNPFIFEQINDYLEYGKYKKYEINARLDAFVQYIDATSNYNIRFVNIKQQAIRFTKGLVGGSVLRKRLSLAKSIDELTELLVQTIHI